MSHERSQAAFASHFILQILDELRYVWIGPWHEITRHRAARRPPISRSRNSNYRAANVVESHHDKTPLMCDKTCDKGDGRSRSHVPLEESARGGP